MPGTVHILIVRGRLYQSEDEDCCDGAEDAGDQPHQAPSVNLEDFPPPAGPGHQGGEQDEEAQGDRDGEHLDPVPVVLDQDGDEEDSKHVKETHQLLGQFRHRDDGDPEGEDGAEEVAELEHFFGHVEGPASFLQT